MKILKTLFFGIIFLLMLSYYYVHEVKEFEENRKKQEEARRVFPSLNQEDILAFTVQGKKGTATLVREKGTWTLKAPVEATGDRETAKALTRELADLKVDALISEKPGNYKEFGLDAPALKIDFSTKKGDRSLWLGDTNPTDTLVYARVASHPKIFTLPVREKRQFNKGPYDLRDKTILPIKKERVKRLFLARKDWEFETKREGKLWRITRPFRWRADKDKIQALLTSIENSRIKKFVSEKPETLQKFGLKEPAAVLKFFSDEGGQERTLWIGGKEKGRNRYYAKRKDAGNIFLIGEAILKKIPEKAEDFRDKKIFAMKADDIFKIRLSEKETLVIRKNEKGDWRILEPKKKRADLFEAGQWADRIARSKIRSFLDKKPGDRSAFGLAPPSLTLEVWEKESAPSQKLLVGKALKAKKGRYAALSGYPDIFTITDEAYQGLLETSAKLRDKKLASFDTEEIEQIEIARGIQKVKLRKSGGKWTVTPSNRTLEAGDVRSILWDITDLAFMKIAAEGKVEMKSFGLENPSLSIRLSKRKNEKAGEIRFGRRVPIEKREGKKEGAPRDRYYAVNENLSEVFEVETDLVNKIEKKFKDWGIRP